MILSTRLSSAVRLAFITATLGFAACDVPPAGPPHFDDLAAARAALDEVARSAGIEGARLEADSPEVARLQLDGLRVLDDRRPHDELIEVFTGGSGHFVVGDRKIRLRAAE